MPTSPETFSKVKNLLRKMDQSIDSARDRRLSTNQRGAIPAVPATPSQPQSQPPAPLPMPPASNLPGSAPARMRAMPRIQPRPAV